MKKAFNLAPQLTQFAQFLQGYVQQSQQLQDKQIAFLKEQKGQEVLQVAQEEIFKAATPQEVTNAVMKNLPKINKYNPQSNSLVAALGEMQGKVIEQNKAEQQAKIKMNSYDKNAKYLYGGKIINREDLVNTLLGNNPELKTDAVALVKALDEFKPVIAEYSAFRHNDKNRNEFTGVEQYRDPVTNSIVEGTERKNKIRKDGTGMWIVEDIGADGTKTIRNINIPEMNAISNILLKDAAEDAALRHIRLQSSFSNQGQLQNIYNKKTGKVDAVLVLSKPNKAGTYIRLLDGTDVPPKDIPNYNFSKGVNGSTKIATYGLDSKTALNKYLKTIQSSIKYNVIDRLESPLIGFDPMMTKEIKKQFNAYDFDEEKNIFKVQSPQVKDLLRPIFHYLNLGSEHQWDLDNIKVINQYRDNLATTIGYDIVDWALQDYLSVASVNPDNVDPDVEKFYNQLEQIVLNQKIAPTRPRPISPTDSREIRKNILDRKNKGKFVPQ